MKRHYLIHGLNALSRAHALSYFEDGHRGGAIISAYYFCKENDVERGVPQSLGRMIDAQWANTELCAPFPDEDAQAELLQEILDTMDLHMAGLRQAGHNIILPALALKAFRDVPEAVTKSRVDGICRLIESFTVSDEPVSERPVQLPEVADHRAFAQFVLEEFAVCAERFTGRGQGWTGHLLTYARALLDLHELGHLPTGTKATEGFLTYVRRIRLGPRESDKPRAEHQRAVSVPLQEAYWQEDKGDWKLGHVVKYPYGYYGLAKHLEGADVKDRCDDLAYKIF